MVAAFAAGGIMAVLLDFGEAKRILVEVNWKIIPAAFVFTAISYVCASYRFVLANRIFGIKVATKELYRTGFVSTALNNVVTVAGIPGYSPRILIMGRWGVPAGDVIGISLFYSYFDYLASIILFVVAVTYILTTHALTTSGFVGLSIIALLLIIILFLGTLVVFLRTVRT